jgi:rRNA maturation RNase YbeY
LGILPKEAVEGPRGRFGVRWQAKRDTALAGAALDAPASPSPHNEPSSPAAATLHGELFICVPEAVAQARRFRVPWQTELLRYVLHGLLHLRGLDDSRPAARRRMKQAEDRCLRQLARRFRLAALGRNQRTSPQ